MQIDEPWAKTHPDGRRLSVIAHCTDVAVCFRALVADDVVRRCLDTTTKGGLSDRQLDRLTVLAGLHDFGKLLKGFQDKLETGPGPSRGHVSEALAVLASRRQDVFAALDLDRLRSWFNDPAAALFTAVCHHGEPVEDTAIQRHMAVVSQLLERTVFGHTPLEEMERLLAALLDKFPNALEQADQITFTPSLQHFFAGLLMAADWMASGFAFDPGSSETRIADLLDRTAFTDWHSGADAFDVLGSYEPRPAQQIIAELPLDERLVVLEAPTGNGKTEAALIWANRLAERGLVDGLYFAVPTRSAAAELHSRIGYAMAASHPKLKNHVVRAVPGMLDVDDPRPDYPPETWAVAAPKRTFAAPVAVGTIDQALLSVIKSRHAWLRAALLSRHLLVIDEVHASDPYMATLTRVLVERHLSLGGYVLAMSATLGETALANLQRRPQRDFPTASKVPYPAIRTGRQEIAFESGQDRCIDLDIQPHETALSLAADKAGEGAAVLYLRSTVADAINDFRELERRNTPCLLHHGRYALVDRNWLDQQLLSVFGKHGERRGLVAVTTQTAEQSLDIDADFMVTDACPADVLIQRLGRLHRHRTGTTPTAVIIDPGPLDQYLTFNGQVRGNDQQGWPWVYNNLLSVRNTLEWIKNAKRIQIPQDARFLVELATHADHLKQTADALGDKWIALWRNLFTDIARQRQLGDAGVIDWNDAYQRALVTDWVPTRLGDGSVTISVSGLLSPFTGQPIQALPIPSRWLRGPVDEDELPLQVVAGQFTINGQAMAYDRFGLGRLGPAG